jgi:hypothetical protein|nr:MAG TPA: hypothetical protein [Caudoviricetes sp.]
MIKLEHTVLPSPEQMDFIIEGMRNPMNSWDRSDSYITYNINSDKIYALGVEDAKLMQKLSKAGTDHRKYMRMLSVYVRITAPLYWWKEFDTYKVGTVANSCSTMHKIQDKGFTLDDFSTEHLNDTLLGTFIPTSAYNHITVSPRQMLENFIIPSMNHSREEFIATKDKAYWWQMIQLLPSSYNQTRNVMLNYEVLSNMYHSRKNHKLDEWREFCKWIENLPYAELIIGE